MKVTICKEDWEEGGLLSRERKTAKVDKVSGRWTFMGWFF